MGKEQEEYKEESENQKNHILYIEKELEGSMSYNRDLEKDLQYYGEQYKNSSQENKMLRKKWGESNWNKWIEKNRLREQLENSRNKFGKTEDNCKVLEIEINKCKEDFENQIKEKKEMFERRTKELESHVCKYSHAYAHNQEVKARLQEDIIRSKKSLETLFGTYKRECETRKREKIELQQKWDESRRSMMADLERCRRECNHQKKEKMKLQSTLSALELKAMFESFIPKNAKYIDEKSYNEKTVHDLKAELRCSVCLEHTKDPHILPLCCHRFCKSCIS